MAREVCMPTPHPSPKAVHCHMSGAMNTGVHGGENKTPISLRLQKCIFGIYSSKEDASENERDGHLG